MRPQVKNRLMIWLVFILFAMNAATIASLVYHTTREKSEPVKSPMESSRVMVERGARFFREQLNLDSAQVTRFRDFNQEYNRNTHDITHDLNQLRLEMVEQMEKNDPDSAQLGNICRRIGYKHEQLKRLTLDYYMKMKSCCNDEQRVKLNSIFRDMVQKEDTLSSNSGRGKGGLRWRGGRK